MHRDLATYEHNFAVQANLHDRVGGIVERLKKARGQLRMTVKFDEDGAAFFAPNKADGESAKDLEMDLAAKSKAQMKEHWTSIYK